MKHDSVTPYNSGEDKNKQVEQMFDNIANRYDMLNTLLSFGIHKGWRRKCIKAMKQVNPRMILDVATGTGDFAIACAELRPEKIVGIDLSEGMLRIGREKVRKKELESIITFLQADAETSTLGGQDFDAITIGFGVRNFKNLEQGLSNLLRRLKPGGIIVILEFSYPTSSIVRAAYNFYLGYVTPLIGRLFSKDRRAYTYLAESVKAFPHNEQFVSILNRCGYVNSDFTPLTSGIAAMYVGQKPR